MCTYVSRAAELAHIWCDCVKACASHPIAKLLRLPRHAKDIRDSHQPTFSVGSNSDVCLKVANLFHLPFWRVIGDYGLDIGGTASAGHLVFSDLSVIEH
jgi:hypothetical protein